MVARQTQGVDSARRVLQLLLSFNESKPAMTIDDIVEQCGISLPSAYRYVSLLREVHLIEERTKGSLVLSPLVLQLARAAEETLDYSVEAQPVLDRLAAETRETALIMRRVKDSAVCLAIAESARRVNISFTPGHLMPLHAGAGAKLLLSDFTKAKRIQYLDRVEPKLSPETQETLAVELEHIRHAGFAESHGEVDEGVWAFAAPVRAMGAQVCVISVVAPEYRLDDERRSMITSAVTDAAVELEQTLEQRR